MSVKRWPQELVCNSLWLWRWLYCTGCRNVCHCQQQQSHSGLRSPGRSNLTYFWRVSIPGRVRSFITKEAATLVHNALILPLFDYCDIAWSNLLQQDIDRLQRLQNRSARIITRCSRSSEAIEQLHWPTLSSRRSYHKAKLVFLCLHSLVPSYFSLYFTRFSNIHNYSTRQSMRLSLPNVKQNFGKRTFLFTGAKFFNKLPFYFMKSENIETFCRRARHFFLS